MTSEPGPAPDGHDEDDDRPDRLSRLMLATAVVAVVATLWLRFGPGASGLSKLGIEAPGVGTPPPVLKLIDAESGEPLLLPLSGPRARVVWLTFWSAESPSTPADLAALEKVWRTFRGRSRFVMAAAAVESDRPGAARAAAGAAGVSLPVYLAPPETRRAYGSANGPLPLHVLIDENGKVGVVARGRDASTLKRLTDQARRWLDELEPLGPARFARS